MPLPLTLKMVERHPLGSQAFMPLSPEPFLVIVAADENGRPGVPRAFMTNGSQGVNYPANAWHGVLTPLAGEQRFLVVDRGGDGNNLEEFVFDEPFMVSADSPSPASRSAKLSSPPVGERGKRLRPFVLSPHGRGAGLRSEDRCRKSLTIRGLNSGIEKSIFIQYQCVNRKAQHILSNALRLAAYSPGCSHGDRVINRHSGERAAYGSAGTVTGAGGVP